MKILLINPFFQFTDSFRGYMKNIGSVLPPLGLASIASVLIEKGYNVKIMDGWIENLSKDNFINKIRYEKADIIGFYTNTSSFYYFAKIIEGLRESNVQSLIIAGGPHSTVEPKKILEICPELDVNVIGEGEFVLLKIIENYESIINYKEIENKGKISRYISSNIDHIYGISYRNSLKHNITIQPPKEFIKNLDDLPFLAWELLEMEKYRPSKANYIRLPSISMITSRGCPYSCSFCSKPLGSTVRFQSAERVFNEMKFLKDRYNIKEVIFEDDCFTLNKNRLIKLTNLMKENHFDIKWSCLTRVDAIDHQFLKIMKESGCWRVGYGVESGNIQVLEKIQKSFSKQQVIDAFKLTKKVGINIRAFFILGSIYDTYETMNQTIKFAKELNPDLAQFSYYVPFPGTKDYDFVVKKGLIDENFYLKEPLNDYHNLKNPIFTPPGVDSDKFKKLHKKAVIGFYFRPKYIISQLRYFKNFELMFRYIRIAKDIIFENI